MSLEIPKVTVTPVLNVVDQNKVEPTKVDAAPPVGEPTKEDPQSQESFSKRFSALNRERKELSKKEVEIKKAQAAIEAEKAELDKWKQTKKAIKDSKNPIAALQEFGYSYEDAAQYLLNDQKPTADLQIKSVEEKVNELQKKLEEKEQEALTHQKKLLETQAHEENKRAIATIRTHLEANPDFDVLVALGMEDDIFNKINSHFHSEETQGEVLKMDDVAKEMILQVEEMLKLVTKTTLFKNKFQAASSPSPKEAPKTLNNSLYSQTTPTDKKQYKTDEERLRNALALLSK